MPNLLYRDAGEDQSGATEDLTLMPPTNRRRMGERRLRLRMPTPGKAMLGEDDEHEVDHGDDESDDTDASQHVPNRLSNVVCKSERATDIEPESGEQVLTRYDELYKALNEKKVTRKNCFNMRMAVFGDSLDSLTTGDTIQKAGTHLESTTRLYGVCVDALANQAIDIVSTLDRRDNKGRRRRQSGEGSDTEDEENGRKRSTRNNVRELVEIEHNKLNVQLEVGSNNCEPDALFKRACSTFNEGALSGLLMAQCETTCDGGNVILHSLSKPKFNELYEPVQSTLQYQETNLDIMRILAESKAKIHIPLCPSLRRDQFSFSYDEPARGVAIGTDVVEDNVYSSDDGVLTDDEVEQGLTRQAILYEDVIEREINEGGYSADADEIDLIDIATEESVGQNGEKTLTPMKTPDKGPGKPAKLLGSGQKRRFPKRAERLSFLLAPNEQDYSYFDARKLKTLKGPSHWRIGTRKSMEPNNKTAPKRRRAPNVQEPIDFEEQQPSGDLFRPTNDGSVLALAAADKNASGHTELLLPESIDYATISIRTLAHKCNVVVRMLFRREINEVTDPFDPNDYMNCEQLYVDDEDAPASNAGVSPTSNGRAPQENAMNDESEDVDMGLGNFDNDTASVATLNAFIEDRSRDFDEMVDGTVSNEHRDDSSADGTICQATNGQDEKASREYRVDEMSSLSASGGFDTAAKVSIAASLSGGGEDVTLSQMLNESLSTPYEVPTFATQGTSVSVPYAKRQKRLNPKRVKEAQWREMTKDAPNNSDRVSDSSASSASQRALIGMPTRMHSARSFSSLAKRVPHRMPQSQRDDLSPSIQFVLLLHLCNEMNLQLQQGDVFHDPNAMTDFTIVQDG